MEIENSGENVVTTATDTAETSVSNVSNEQNAQTESENTAKRMFTDEEVSKIMQKRVNRSHQSFYNRYKVKDLQELDEKFGLIDSLTTERDALLGEKEMWGNEKTELLNKLAFIENDVNPEKKDDILAYFKGKGVELNSDNLKQELETHSEWLNVKSVEETPKTTIKTLSPSRSKTTEKTEEDEMAEEAKLFGLPKIYKFR